MHPGILIAWVSTALAQWLSKPDTGGVTFKTTATAMLSAALWLCPADTKEPVAEQGSWRWKATEMGGGQGVKPQTLVFLNSLQALWPYRRPPETLVRSGASYLELIEPKRKCRKENDLHLKKLHFKPLTSLVWVNSSQGKVRPQSFPLIPVR